jgi:hypothetical protein
LLSLSFPLKPAGDRQVPRVARFKNGSGGMRGVSSSNFRPNVTNKSRDMHSGAIWRTDYVQRSICKFVETNHT